MKKLKQYVIALLIASFLAVSSLGIGITVITNASEIMEDDDVTETVDVVTQEWNIEVFKYYGREDDSEYEYGDGLEGWTFELFGDQGMFESSDSEKDHGIWIFLAEGETDGDGIVTFEIYESYMAEDGSSTGGPPDRPYHFKVREVLEDGWFFTGGEIIEGSNDEGSTEFDEENGYVDAPTFWTEYGENVTLEFGNALNWDLRLFKFHDIEATEGYSGDDYPIPEWRFGLYKVVNDDWVHIDDYYTNETGRKLVPNILEPGEQYIVKDYLPPGWYKTYSDAQAYTGWPTPSAGTQSGTLGVMEVDGENPEEDERFQIISFTPRGDWIVTFGNSIDYGEIEVRKFYDANYDGEYDTEEELIDGFMFQLWAADEHGNPIEEGEIGEPVATTDGTYTFEDLEPGYYVVEEIEGYYGEDDDCCWFPTTDVLQFVPVKPDGEHVLYFGNVQGGNITGMKFLDVKATGEFEVGLDKPLAGWTINLYEAVEEEPEPENNLAATIEPELVRGDHVATEITNSLGAYKFECVAPGYYFVEEEIPDGWYNVTEQMQLVQVRPCTTTEDVDFANCMYKDIYGIKFYDNSTSGTFEPDQGDYLIEGWEIILLDEEGEVLQTTHTLANGYYFFEGLKVGTYYIEEAVPDDEEYDPEGWVRTTPDDEEYPVRIELNCCTPCTVVNFGNYERPQITIRKFYDTTMSGDFQEGEGDFLMTEELFVFNVSKDGLFSDTLGVTGEWTFYVDAGSNYSVEEILAPGWHNTTDLIQSTEYPLGPGDHVTFEFGNVRLGNIEVFKFHDRNMSGEYDEEDEYGLDGWTFHLWNATMDNDYPIAGEPIATNVTNEDGIAMFWELEPGWYMVEEIGKVGWEATTDVFLFVEVPLEETVRVEFGNVELGEITVFKFHDCDVTGEYTIDLNAPLEGWNITLHNEANELVGYGYTDGNGEITFEGLLPGEYYVSEVLQDCWMNTTELPVSVTLEAGGEVTVEIGNAQYGWISGYKYCGYEGYEGEPIPRWTIYLYVGDDQINSTQTNETGYYEFRCLEPGQYTVREEVPDDWYNYSPDNETVYVDLEEHHEIDFYNYRHADIWGMKYCDFNMNGEFDECLDWPIFGWEIQLWNATDEGEKMDGELIDVAYTDNWGMYRFEDLAPGHYVVKEVLGPCGWMNTTDSEVHVHITGCMECEEVNFGNYRQSNIKVKAYDYERYEPEAGLALYLWEADEYGNPIGDEPIAEGVTGDHGYYIFGKYDPGYYLIETEDEQTFNVTLRCCTAYVIIEYYNDYTPENDTVLATYAKIE